MPAPYTPLAVANFFIDQFGGTSGIEHMKLQKLVYCAHGWWLAQEGNVALVNEKPEVWKFGPVFPGLYSVLKIFGREPIVSPQSKGPFEEPEIIDPLDQNTARLLEWVWRRYGHLSSFALSDLTHKPGTPWHRLATEHSFLVPQGLGIPDSYIAQEFRDLYGAEFSIDAQQ